ncbi:MAG: hypothetical protein GX495_10610 [Chloroflexi bacterium]|jgi:hypothetical protein|nr:hypothetical protein [Chloroflexota bacterium]
MQDFNETELPSPAESPPPPQDRPALVINIQSWATPIVGLIMLAVGLLGGYIGRPLLEKSTPTAVAVNPTPSVPQSAAGTEQQRQEMMAFLVDQTKHLKGDDAAPVTIIEFSDFQ